MIRTLLVDDEPLAREGLRLRLRAEPDVEVVGEAGDGASAARAMVELAPDLVFLDVQMPGGDGFAALEAAAPQHLPLVVFCTAFDEHALRAFEVHALDYLLKPPGEARLREAVERARRALRLATGEAQGREAALISSRAPSERLLVSHGRRFVVLDAEELDYVQADANYLRLHARGVEFLRRSTLASLAERLDRARFLRIHRSTLVNLDRVAEIQPLPQGDHEVVLRDGRRLRVGRAYREVLLGRLRG